MPGNVWNFIAAAAAASAVTVTGTETTVARTCDDATQTCTVHQPRTYKTLGRGVAVEEGNTVAYIKPCDAICCRKECDADPLCFSFSHRMNYCYLKDRE